MRYVHGTEQGVDIQAATIRGQRGQVEAWEVASMKLEEEVCNFLREVAQFTELAEPHLISAHHLLPPQRPPTNIVLPPTSKMVGDLTPALRSGPNIAADAEAAALILVLGLLAHVGPPPVRSQRYLHLLTGFACHMLPVVVLVALISVVDSSWTTKLLSAVMQHYVILLHIATLDCASHETRSFLPPGMCHQRAQGRISLVYIGAWSLHVNLVRSLCRLAAAVDQAAPPHDLGCTVHHGVNLLTAQVEHISALLEWKQAGAHGHKLPCKGVQTKQRTHYHPGRSPVMTYYNMLTFIIAQ